MQKVFAFLIVLATLASVSAAPPFTVETGLQRLWDLSMLPEMRAEKVRMNSSGGFGPDAHDGSLFLYRDANGEYVLFDAAGPGCLIRYWSAMVKEDMQIRIYLDGHTTPDIDMPLIDMFSGKVFPWMPPVVGDPKLSSGGSYSYLPIPYAKSCRVTLNCIPSFYQLEAINLEGYDVETFSLDKVTQYQKAVDQTCKNMASPPKRIESGSLRATTLKPGKAVTLVDVRGPAVLDEFVVTLDEKNPALLRDLLVRAWWDGEESPSVWAPLGDFFTLGFEFVDFQALPVSMANGEFRCRFPMPFRKSGRLELANQSSEPVAVRYGASVKKLDTYPDNLGAFHARWQRVTTELFEYVPVLETPGRGHFVGLALNAQAVTPWMLEGDEIVHVDLETMPSWHGTGTEDYFSGAWYFKEGEFAVPTHGAPLLELDSDIRRVSLYRFHTIDAITFQEDIRFLLEHGQERTVPGADYGVTAYWYQQEPHQARFAMPSAPERRVDAAPVLAFAKALEPWEAALKNKDAQTVANLGLDLLAEYMPQTGENRIRLETGRALKQLGRTQEAIEVWMDAEQFFGIDFREGTLCQVEAWAARGQKGNPGKDLLSIIRVEKPQAPGKFDAALWDAMPMATGFTPSFPNPYTEMPYHDQTQVKMAYDDEFLYIRATCFDRTMDNLTVLNRTEDHFDFEEDGLLIGVDPERDYADSYFIRLSAGGRICAGQSNWGIDIIYGQKALDIDLEGRGQAVVTKHADSWIVEARVPLKAVGLAGAVKGRPIGLQLMRVYRFEPGKGELSKWGKSSVAINLAEFNLGRFE